MSGPPSTRYRIDEELGSGGMGVVYRAFDTHLRRTVAIKVFRDDRLDGETHRRLMKEAQAASSLNHPHVCTVHEVSELDGAPCIVMEHVEGTTLSSSIPPDGLPPDTAARLGIQIADALAHAHARGIVHRDLKSANIMVTADGHVKVVDFGLATRLRHVQAAVATESEASMSDGHPPAGTLAYMSPEALQGQRADARDDVWALGVVLYEMVSGRRPFTGSTAFDLASAIQRDAPPPLPASVPAALRAVIAKCLSRPASTRYGDAREIRAALETVQSGTVEVSAAPRPRRVNWRLAVVLMCGVSIVALAALALLRPEPIDSIAVLPFVNASGDPGMDYLTDGVTESVLSSLTQLSKEHLKIIALSSVLRFKGRELDPQVVGHELNVRAVVLGRVVQHGDTLLVSAELVDVSDRSRLWGDKYETTIGNLLGVQEEIATHISTGLRLQLSGRERQQLTRRYTDNLAAYQAYLKGRYHWYKFTPEDMKKSLEYYQQAIDIDPTYALAYAGMARDYEAMAYQGLAPPAESHRAGEAAAKRALEIDDNIGQAHEALAQVQFAREWDWPSAEREYRRAIALNPADAFSHRFYGHFLRAMGRWPEAAAEMRRSLELDPLSAETSKALATTYFWGRQLDAAIDQYNKTLELEPNHALTHDLLADAYAAAGRYNEALAERRSYLRLEGATEAADGLGDDSSESGYRRAMQALYRKYLAVLQQTAASEYVSPVAFALTYAALGEQDRAFEWLERAFAERAPYLTSMKTDPAFDPLRSDPRFDDLMRRVGLP